MYIYIYICLYIYMYVYIYIYIYIVYVYVCVCVCVCVCEYIYMYICMPERNIYRYLPSSPALFSQKQAHTCMRAGLVCRYRLRRADAANMRATAAHALVSLAALGGIISCFVLNFILGARVTATLSCSVLFLFAIIANMRATAA